MQRIRLAYDAPYGGKRWIWTARGDGSHRKRLVVGVSPVLAPDGRAIAFVRHPRSPGSQVWSMSAEGGGPRLLARSPWASSSEGIFWAPDSRKIVLVEGRRLVLVDTGDGNTRRLVEGWSIGSASFSPDSRELVYARGKQAISEDLYLYDIPSGHTRWLTRDHSSYAPLWGSKGIAYSRRIGGRDDVWLIDPAGASPRRLTHTRAALGNIYPEAWSANGSRLLAANPAVHNGRLWAVEVGSGRYRNLTGWVGDLFPQGLSRDGKMVLAAIGCGGRQSMRGVVEVIPFAGGKPRVVLHGPCRASWNG